MKKIYLIILGTLMTSLSFSQENTEEKKLPTVQFSGYFIYEAYFDSYGSVTSREGDIYLYPSAKNPDANGKDINEHGQLNMFSGQSRFRAKMDGPDAFGAKVSGLAEIDFLGKANSFEQTPRIRHMFMGLTWNKTQLILGQTWHPIFAVECFPEVLGMGAGLPFNPLNRAPQVKVNYKINDEITFTGAALSYLDHASTGPVLAQQYAVVPDFHFSLKYVSDNIATGLIGGYKLLKPRLHTVNGVITDETIGSYDVAAFFRIKVNNLTFKLYDIYGQNLSQYVMIGGYGAAENPTTIDDYTYSNINTMAVWSEIMYQSGAVGYGLFGGYSANMSSSKDGYYSIAAARGENIDNLWRISPRITYTSGKVLLGLEYMLTSATYASLATNGKYEGISMADPVKNNRIQFFAKYSF